LKAQFISVEEVIYLICNLCTTIVTESVYQFVCAQLETSKVTKYMDLLYSKIVFHTEPLLDDLMEKFTSEIKEVLKQLRELEEINYHMQIG